MSHEEKIAKFLKDAKPSAQGDSASIQKSRDLFKDGWLDSLLHVKLLTWIEKEFGKKLPALCAARKNFTTVKGIAEMIGKVK